MAGKSAWKIHRAAVRAWPRAWRGSFLSTYAIIVLSSLMLESLPREPLSHSLQRAKWEQQMQGNTAVHAGGGGTDDRSGGWHASAACPKADGRR
jgi:hypothetical protein